MATHTRYVKFHRILHAGTSPWPTFCTSRPV